MLRIPLAISFRNIVLVLILGSGVCLPTRWGRAESLSTRESGKFRRFVRLSYEDTSADRLFLKELHLFFREGSSTPRRLDRLWSYFVKTSFPKLGGHGLAMTVYGDTGQRVRAFSFESSARVRFERVVGKALERYGTELKDVRDPLRIQIDFTELVPGRLRWHELSDRALDEKRFEVGVDGLLLEVGEERELFLPGDSYVKSFLSLSQIEGHLKQRVGRESLAEVSVKRLRSESYVSYEGRWIRLFRGHPVIGEVSTELLETAAEAGVRYVIDNQSENGQFLYYYDAANDSLRDHEHPDRDPKTNPYYNEVRHAGGGVLLLDYFAAYPSKNIAEAARRAAHFLCAQVKERQLDDGTQAGCVYYNRKAKLGASGLGLHFISEYSRLVGDKTYDNCARLIKNHVLSQILPSGEFLYYYLYLDKTVPTDQNHRFFSFYYPGEAVLGLLSYYRHLAKDEIERRPIEGGIRNALRFLFQERPRTRAEFYTALPSDAWLMSAVNELWDWPSLRDEEYRRGVFGDADKMINQMYNSQNALYPDYRGAFYYEYGDFPYADGARAEGLVAALALAMKSGDMERVQKYQRALWEVAWATYHLVNTKESVYSVPHPEKTVGGIRFKHTRQWFRVDTIQHVGSFYLKFLKLLGQSRSQK